MSLARVLSTVVFGGSAVACGTSAVIGNDCPHTVVDRASTVNLSSNDACGLASQDTESINGPYLDPAACKIACHDSTVTDCILPSTYMSHTTFDQDSGITSCPVPDAGATVPVTCRLTHSEGTYHAGCPVAGRRTAGFVAASREPHGPTMGYYFARCAELEALSVYAFERLARELRAVGAPTSFSKRAEQAAMEEVRHASTMANLAARFGTTPPALQMGALPLRPLFEIALENAVEGVVRETFGAAIALHQSVHADDPDVRAAHVAIAEEERTHAELAIELDAWFATRLDEGQRARIELAKAEAIDALRVELDQAPPSTLRAGAGLPPATQALAILDGLFRALSDELAVARAA